MVRSIRFGHPIVEFSSEGKLDQTLSKSISFATEEDLVLSSIVVSFHIGHAFCHAPIEVVLVGGGAKQVLLVAIMNEGQHQKRQRQ